MLWSFVMRVVKDPLILAGSFAAFVVAGVMLPMSPLYAQTSGSYDAPGGHTEDEGQIEQDYELAYTVLTRQRLDTPHGSVEFGVMKYTTPDGDVCFDTAVADSSALVGKGGGGYCANEPLGANEHIRASMGSQLLFFKPPSSDAIDSTTSVPPIPYYTTDISGNTNIKVSAVTASYVAEGIAQSFSVTPQNGAFLIVLPGYIQAPQVTVAAIGEKGKVLQTVVVMNCLNPDCTGATTGP